VVVVDVVVEVVVITFKVVFAVVVGAVVVVGMEVVDGGREVVASPHAPHVF